MPEFNKFLSDNPISEPGTKLAPEAGSTLLGARMVGQWKSVCCSSEKIFMRLINLRLKGTPVDLAPLFDDPSAGVGSYKEQQLYLPS